MPISIIAPPNLLPLGDQPTRLSVRIDEALLSSLDPSMESIAPGDSQSRTRRKGKAAIKTMAREVSAALFGGREVAPLEVYWSWPKHVEMPASDGQEGKKMMQAGHYTGIIFDHLVTEGDNNPRLLGLTADEVVDGVVVFRAKELDAERREFMNKFMYDSAQRVANWDFPGVGRTML